MSFKLLLFAVMSSTLLLGDAAAHESRPSVAEIVINQDRVQIEMEIDIDAQILDLNLSDPDDLNNGPTVDEYLDLLDTPQEELIERWKARWPDLSQQITLLVDGNRQELTLDGIEYEALDFFETQRFGLATISAPLDHPDAQIKFGWAAELGMLVVRHQTEEGGFWGLLPLGELTPALTRSGTNAAQNAWLYVRIGFEHIIPKGADHILFVLGLFFFSLRWRVMVLQVSAFTVSHMITLALASTQILRVSPAVVEPLIALSIAVIAIENIWGKGVFNMRRLAVVFAFGLLHGLGFAGVLAEFMDGSTNFLSTLILLAIGIELGQLAVLALAFVALGLTFGKQVWYRKFIAVPASVVIALVGLYWGVERIFF